MRPTLLPPLPWLSGGEQINVRTYVHRDGVPGLWFLSLDITQPIAVWAARLTYALPYYRAKMRVACQGDRVRFTRNARMRARRRPASSPHANPGARYRRPRLKRSNSSCSSVTSGIRDRTANYGARGSTIDRGRRDRRRSSSSRRRCLNRQDCPGATTLRSLTLRRRRSTWGSGRRNESRAAARAAPARSNRARLPGAAFRRPWRR